MNNMTNDSLERARAAVKLRRFAEAEAFYRGALSDESCKRQAYIELAGVLRAGRRFQDALDLVNEGFQYYPEDTWLHLERGHALSGLTEFDLAREAYDRSFVMDPKNVSALLALGEMYRNLGDNEKQRFYISSAQSIAADNKWVIFDCLKLSIQEGVVDSRSPLWKRALEGDDFAGAELAALAELLREQGLLREYAEVIRAIHARGLEYVPPQHVEYSASIASLGLRSLVTEGVSAEEYYRRAVESIISDRYDEAVGFMLSSIARSALRRTSVEPLGPLLLAVIKSVPVTLDFTSFARSALDLLGRVCVEDSRTRELIGWVLCALIEWKLMRGETESLPDLFASLDNEISILLRDYPNESCNGELVGIVAQYLHQFGERFDFSGGVAVSRRELLARVFADGLRAACKDWPFVSSAASAMLFVVQPWKYGESFARYYPSREDIAKVSARYLTSSQIFSIFAGLSSDLLASTSVDSLYYRSLLRELLPEGLYCTKGRSSEFLALGIVSSILEDDEIQARLDAELPEVSSSPYFNDITADNRALCELRRESVRPEKGGTPPIKGSKSRPPSIAWCLSGDLLFKLVSEFQGGEQAGAACIGPIREFIGAGEHVYFFPRSTATSSGIPTGLNRDHNQILASHQNSNLSEQLSIIGLPPNFLGAVLAVLQDKDEAIFRKDYPHLIRYCEVRALPNLLTDMCSDIEAPAGCSLITTVHSPIPSSAGEGTSQLVNLINILSYLLHSAKNDFDIIVVGQGDDCDLQGLRSILLNPSSCLRLSRQDARIVWNIGGIRIGGGGTGEFKNSQIGAVCSAANFAITPSTGRLLVEHYRKMWASEGYSAAREAQSLAAAVWATSAQVISIPGRIASDDDRVKKLAAVVFKDMHDRMNRHDIQLLKALRRDILE